jgi:hypothetical protein
MSGWTTNELASSHKNWPANKKRFNRLTRLIRLMLIFQQHNISRPVSDQMARQNLLRGGKLFC